MNCHSVFSIVAPTQVQSGPMLRLFSSELPRWGVEEFELAVVGRDQVTKCLAFVAGEF